MIDFFLFRRYVIKLLSVCLLLFFINKGKAQDISTSIFPYIFTDRIIAQQIYPEIQTSADLNSRLLSIDITPYEYFHADSLISNYVYSIKDSIYYSNFSISQRQYKAYCYFKQGLVTEDSVAFLIIPGSGLNQSIDIYKGIQDNYQGDISNHTIKYGDTYVFVKPNEDFLAWYSNNYKLNVYGYINYILNRGYSYSAYYITQAIAVAKELKSRYRKVVILGCSQGASAALLIALQTEPTACVVASGYSILFDQLDWSSQAQIVIPGLSQYYSAEKIKNIIKSHKTTYLFTYGMLEGDFYKLEAYSHITKTFFSGVDNALFSSDLFGHTYPQPKVENFIVDILRPKPILKLVDYQNQIVTDYQPGYKYIWYKNDNDSIPLQDSTNHYFVTESGYYRVKVITASGISALSDSIQAIYYLPVQTILSDTSNTGTYVGISINTDTSINAINTSDINSMSLSSSTISEAKSIDFPIYESLYSAYFQYGNLNISLRDNNSDIIALDLISMDLKRMFSVIINKKDEAGNYIFNISPDLANGIYILRMTGKYHNLAFKLVKN